MQQELYTFAVARVRAKEATLFTAADFERLLACKTHEEALRFLKEKGWGSENTATTEEVLQAETEKTWQFINSVAADPKAFAVFRYQADFHNLKAAVKLVCSDLQTEAVPQIFEAGGNLPAEEILEAVKKQQWDRLPRRLADPGKAALEQLLQTRDGQLCDLELDRACLEAIAETGKKAENEAVRQYAETVVSGADVRIAARCAATGKDRDLILRSLAPCESLNVSSLAAAAAGGTEKLLAYLKTTPYGETADLLVQSPGAFDCWCDNLMIRRLKPQKYNPFTIGPLVGYLLARESEIKSARIILSAKLNGLPQEEVRERLRECYV